MRKFLKQVKNSTMKKKLLIFLYEIVKNDNTSSNFLFSEVKAFNLPLKWNRIRGVGIYEDRSPSRPKDSDKSKIKNRCS